MFSIKCTVRFIFNFEFFLLSLAQKSITIALLVITGNILISNEVEAERLYTISDLPDNYFTTYSLKSIFCHNVIFFFSTITNIKCLR